MKPDAPPTILFHGIGGTTVKSWTAETFVTAMEVADNRCDLQPCDGQPHGFFNCGCSGNKHYELTTKALDEFLVSLRHPSNP